jgi:hypothetical protein
MNRAEHRAEAERLTELAVGKILAASSDTFPALREADRDTACLYLRAALVYATLFAAEPDARPPVITATPPRPKPGPPPTQGAPR